MDKETIKEIALVSSVIIKLDILGGSIWQTFDKAYDIALTFVEAYPPDQYDGKWGEDIDGLGDYEETIQNFVFNYLDKN